MGFGLSRGSNHSPAVAVALSDNPAIAHGAAYDKSFDYRSTTLLTTYRAYARWIRSLAHRGASPETILKAERGVASCGGGS
jgi:hypothetical protein